MYKEFAPKFPLNKFVNCFWILKHDYSQSYHSYEHLWADTKGELIFQFGNPYYKKTGTEKNTLPDSIVIGPCSREIKLYSEGNTGLIAVRFQPWGMFPFISQKMTDIINKIIPSEKLFGEAINQYLREYSNLGWSQRITGIEHFFTTKLKSINEKEIISQSLCQIIIEREGNVKVSNLLENVDLSQRQVERIFKKETGFTPKLFSKIIRFGYAKKHIEKNPDIDLATLSFDTGYSDQSHFTNNFNELFGMTPAEFKQRVKKLKTIFSVEDSNVEFLQEKDYLST